MTQAARRAAARGVLFDVGHGKGSFSFQVARRALAQGFRPGTISSDLHVYNLEGPVFDLATTMSKFLHLGLSLDEVVAMTTGAPAQVIGHDRALGTLRPGAAGGRDAAGAPGGAGHVRGHRWASAWKAPGDWSRPERCGPAGGCPRRRAER